MKKCVIIILAFLYIIQGTAKDTREIIIRGDSAFPPYEFINDNTSGHFKLNIVL